MKFNRLAVPLCAAVLMLTGCGPAKLNQERTFNVAAGDSFGFGPDTLDAEQNIQVEVNSDKKVDIYVVLSSTMSAAMAMKPAALKEKSLVSKMDTVAEKFPVKIPAKTPCVVVICLPKGDPATGTIRLTN